MHLVIDFITF